MEYTNSHKLWISDIDGLNIIKGNYHKVTTCSANNELSDSISTALSESAKPRAGYKNHVQLCKLRLNKAMNLLSDLSYNISEVAFMCGFNDPKYFSTCFKNKFGVTPKEFRLKHVNSYENDYCTNNPFVQRATIIIEANLSEPRMPAEIFASQMNVSKSTLYRKILKLTGFAPCDFIRNIRICKAMQMLESSNKNISEIAFAVGFNDTKYFCKCFKNLQGISPYNYKLLSEITQKVKSR